MSQENEKVRFSFQTGHGNHSSRSTSSGSLMFFDFLQSKWNLIQLWLTLGKAL